MIAKSIRKALAAQPEAGPTIEALSHGAIEIRPLARGGKRGVVMARRVGMHERLYARGKITDADWNWACRYVVETEIAAGARPGKPALEPVDSWSGPMIYNRQCAANGFLRRAHERISYQDRLVLVAACVECLVVADLGKLLGLPARAEETATDHTNRISTRVSTACTRIIQQASQKNEGELTRLRPG